VNDRGEGPPRFPSHRTAVLTTHFGDLGWVELLVRRIRSFLPEIADENIFVVDQDRTDRSEAALRERLGGVTILRWPESEPHFVITGHDHAHVLNLAVRAIDSDFLLIFDSDAHPIGPEFRARLAACLAENDAVLAARWITDTATHPCFMAFGPAVDRARLLFDEQQLEHGVDTGRRIYDQVAALGLTAELLRPEPAFRGRWGTLYLDGTVYHHGSGSFVDAADPRLQGQARRVRLEHRFFKKRVFADRYRLSRQESVEAAVLAFLQRLPERAVSLARRLVRPLRSRLQPRLGRRQPRG
jgi:hypothetical protein